MDRTARARRVACLAAGVIVVTGALSPPAHRLAEALLTAHMIQHLALVLVAAPLLAAGRPAATIVRALPRTARRRAARILARVPARRPIRAALRHPGFVWGAHAGVLWAWHMPWLYDRALDSAVLHAAEHASFVASGVAFWGVLARPRDRRRLGVGGGLVYLFTAAIQSTVLGALLTLADRPWYAAHAATAERASGLSPLEDQHVAGLIMWIPAGCVYLAAILVLVASWLIAPAEPGAAPEHRTRDRRTARVLTILLALMLVAGCRSEDGQRRPALEGDPARGVAALRAHGCGACHRIPGLRGPHGSVGSPLDRFADRIYIAGALPNDETNLARWIRNPQAIEPGTAMPALGVSERDALDIAAYLLSLR
jgi:putative membrane protein